MQDLFLSVVIPCFDEMANLQKGVLDKVVNFLKRKKYSYEVIIVDDGSSDGSVTFIEKFTRENPHVSLVKNGHLGKAGAVTTGMLKAKGKYLLFCDMDQATPIEEMEKLLPYFDLGYQVVIGSRKNRRKGSPISRQIMSRGWMVLRNITIGLGIEDTQCGFKMFTNEAAKDLFGKLNQLHDGFKQIEGSNVSAGFDVEILYLAVIRGYKIEEVPVDWLYVETRRVNLIKDSFESLFSLWQIKKNAMQGKYN